MGILLRNIRRLYQVAAGGERCKRGRAMQDAAALEDAWLLAEDGLITGLGPMSQLPADAARHEQVDCSGRLVLPGFVDSHTHLVFPRTREQEFVDRIRGLSYEEIARRGGGILNSMQHCGEMSEAQLLEDGLRRAAEILRSGTTTVEIKSGYGLTVESELKLLRTARRIGELTPLNVRTTFLGAHAIPKAYQHDRHAYIRLVCEEMLPAVMAEGLADFIDVFCDIGFFTPEETEIILRAGEAWGLPAKIHANELGISGGVEVGIKMQAYSVDHLERVGAAEISLLRETDTVPVLLPSVAFFLGIPYAPARAMIEAGLPVALATDYNPGSSPGGSMPFVMSLACTQLRMLPEEALTACTLNGAFALRMSDRIGSLEPGKQADLILTHPADTVSLLPYAYASSLVDRVMIRGSWV